MKISRRTFMGAIGIAALTVEDALGFFQKKRVEAKAAIIGPPKQGEPHKSVAYVYNAGMDFTGVQDHTFNKYSVIPGGKITRIEQCEEWTERGLYNWSIPGRELYSQPGRFAKLMGIRPRKIGYKPSVGDLKRAVGLYRIERIETGRWKHLDYDSLKHTAPDLTDKYLTAPRTLTEEEWDRVNTSWYEEPNFENRHIIVHPAKEIAESLADSSLHYSARNQVVVLDFWNDRQVDVEGVNALIEADTIARRMKTAELLLHRNESWARLLAKVIRTTLAEHEKVLRTYGRFRSVDLYENQFDRELKALLA